MLGGVPIRVMLPPNNEEKASGISRREAGIPVWRAIWITAGSSTAAAPMLFMKADMQPQVSMSTAIKRGSLPPASRRMRSPRKSATPVLNSPAETM